MTVRLRRGWCRLWHRTYGLTNVTGKVVCETCGEWWVNDAVYRKKVSDATAAPGWPVRNRGLGELRGSAVGADRR